MSSKKIVQHNSHEFIIKKSVDVKSAMNHNMSLGIVNWKITTKHPIKVPFSNVETRKLQPSCQD